MDNTSGRGASAAIPSEVERWNWGAFLLNWIWGIGNNTFIALLMFVPFVNFVVAFVLGAKGGSWAWRNKRWDSVEQFKAVQRKWAQWGFVAWAAAAVVSVALFFAIMASLKTSDVFKLAVERLEANQEASEFLGRPVATGMPRGRIEVSGPSGTANLSFGVEGPKGKGTVYVDAVKDLGRWQLNRIVLDEDGTGHRVDLEK